MQAEQQRFVTSSFAPEKLRDALFQALNQHSQATALAALHLLAKQGELLQLLKTDSRFYYLLANYYRTQHNLNALKDFHMSFANPHYVRELVRYILEVALKLSSSEAAHVAVDLLSMLKQRSPDLEHWGYYDERSQKYKWLP